MSGRSVLVDVKDGCVQYGGPQGIQALASVNLRVHAGERVALVGSNGCGKSTLLRCLHRLIPLCGGSMHLEPDARQAMLFQYPHMYRMSVMRNLTLALWLARVPRAEARERAMAGLERVGLSDLAGRNAKALSGGQRQRLALARAWVLQPDLWLLDEPTASLDPHAKREVEELIAGFSSTPGRRHPPTLVFASHNLGQVKRLATRVVYMEHGSIHADLPVEDFFDHQCLEAVSAQAHAFVKGEGL
ncbi:phosphate ABC transporter ATP-binding protein [Hydrogenophaga sp. 5NK40-0174]|uniref:ABC transporter ATP-binding protein n=1 Tax=Hydrogenophaga sp. 5NK40-0174 TaxID=3127649 RepID=UPI0031075F23